MVTSQTICDEEMNLVEADSIPRKFADLPLDALDQLECLGDQHIDGLDDPHPKIKGRDLTLLRIADACSTDGSVLLLTDDEDLVTGTLEVAMGMTDAQVAVWAKHSIEFLGLLHDCGALSLETLITVADAEESYAQDRWVGELLKKKLTRIRDTLNEAVHRESLG